MLCPASRFSKRSKNAATRSGPGGFKRPGSQPGATLVVREMRSGGRLTLACIAQRREFRWRHSRGLGWCDWSRCCSTRCHLRCDRAGHQGTDKLVILHHHRALRTGSLAAIRQQPFAGSFDIVGIGNPISARAGRRRDEKLGRRSRKIFINNRSRPCSQLGRAHHHLGTGEVRVRHAVSLQKPVDCAQPFHAAAEIGE